VKGEKGSGGSGSGEWDQRTKSREKNRAFPVYGALRVGGCAALQRLTRQMPHIRVG